MHKADNSKQNKIEDILFDKQFIDLVEKNDTEEIERFLDINPDKKELYYNAFLLSRHLKIELQPVSDQSIITEWNSLLSTIELKKRRKKRIYTIWVSASTIAACIALLIYLSFNPYRLSGDLIPEKKENLLARIDSLEFDNEEVLIVTGEKITQVDNNETIIQTGEGSLLVRDEKKLESDHIETEYVTIIVPKGKRTNIQFNDGTVAWVNSGTRLIYPRIFSGQNRTITIDGEIFLDVANLNDQPFMVETRNFIVEVTGTQFNVCSYGDEDINSVILVEGSVEVIAGDESQKLLPNQGFFAENGNHSIHKVDVYPYISWKEGIMQLDGESLSFILKRLSRHYGVEIEFNENLYMEPYKGKLDLNEMLETVLYNISLSTPLRFLAEEDKVIIVEND